MSLLTTAKLWPVFGPEKNTYLRMVYGSSLSPYGGLTRGKFYDMRGLPVPHKPFDPTWFQLDIIDESLDGKTVSVLNSHKESIEGGSSDKTNIVLSYPTTVFSMRLAHGMNWVRVVMDNEVIADSTVTSTHYASLLYQSALEIYDNVWQRLESIGSDIFAGDGTRLTAMLLKDDDHFSHSASLNKAARSVIVNALMNYPASARAIRAMSQAVLGTSVHVSDVPQRWVGQAWMPGGVQSAAEAYPAGKIFTAWAPDSTSAHFAVAPWFLTSHNTPAIVGPASISIEGHTHDMSDLRKPIDFPTLRKEAWIELADSKDILDIDVWPMNRQWGRVQAPGMWDYQGSYFDTGAAFDSNRQLDQSQKSLDISMTGFVGMKLVNRDLIDHTGEPSIGLISASAMSFFIDNTSSVIAASWTDVLIWALDISSTLADTTTFNAPSTFAVNNISATSGQKASTKFGATLTLGDLSAGHKHLTSTLTKGQVATVKSGTPVTLTSEHQDDDLQPKHTHQLRVSWRDGLIVEITGNHGHDATISEAA